MVQFGRELGAGRAGTDDGHVELVGSEWRGLRVGADAGVDNPLIEAGRLLGRLERDRMLLDAWSVEVVGQAADRHHQRVVGQLAPG